MAVTIACGCVCHHPRSAGEITLGGVVCVDCAHHHKLGGAYGPTLTVHHHTDPDPDKETPMTTIPIPDTAPELGTTSKLILTVDDRTLIGHDADEVTTLITKANASPIGRNYVQKAKGGEGVGALGLYLEAVVHTTAGKPFTHIKYFVVDRHVAAYARTVGESRANWKRRDMASLQAALETVQSAIDKPNVKVFGHPVLVELQADDLSSLEEGGMPPARFRGQYRIEKDFGRYDFEMGIVSTAIPASLLKMLLDGHVVNHGIGV
jgi:hypothetical protein